jgi:nitronate monooxygenase
MAGGISTPALVSAVGEARALGFLAAGYLSADELRADIEELRALSTAPFGLNVFVPEEPSEPRRQLAVEYAEELGAWLGEAASKAGLGEPRYSDDEYDAKVAIALEVRPSLVSFTFGLPSDEVVVSLHDVGVPVAVTVTTAAEAEQAAARGVDAVVVQGWEAGGHRGSFLDDSDVEQPGLLSLLRLVAATTRLPMIAAGGIADGAAVAGVLAAGATAAMLGTAFMLTDEAGTSPVHRAAFSQGRASVVTRAYTGRRARGLDNELIRAMRAGAPSAYPEVHYLTSPMRAAARAGGDPERLHLWAGQCSALARQLPAGELVRQLDLETRTIREPHP